MLSSITRVTCGAPAATTSSSCAKKGGDQHNSRAPTRSALAYYTDWPHALDSVNYIMCIICRPLPVCGTVCLCIKRRGMPSSPEVAVRKENRPSFGSFFLPSRSTHLLQFLHCSRLHLYLYIVQLMLLDVCLCCRHCLPANTQQPWASAVTT
jgi:hypothetical protein